MIAGLKPYPAMKASGVPWLGKVPEHWDASRVKNLARPGYKTFVDGDWIESPYITDEGIRLIQTGNVGVGVYREKGFRYISESTFAAFGCTEFQPGDVLICRLGEPVGRACLAPDLDVRMITSVDVCILKPREDILPAFAVHAMSSAKYLGWVNSLVRGSTRDRVSRSMLGGFFVPVPPLPEQVAIVRFLSYVDRRIRRYVRAKQKLITLLEEQKQAIFHRAVTRGLDPSVRLKPTGVKWLGEVPEHWDTLKLKHVVSFSGGGTPSKTNAAFWKGNIPWVSPKDMTETWITDSEDHITQEAVASSATSIVPAGALLMVVRSGILRRAIPVAINAVDVTLNQDMKALRPRVQVALSEFLRALVQGNEGSLIREWTKQGATVESIEHELLANTVIPRPPLPEQAAIVRFLDEQTKDIVAASERARSEVDLLREYRTRLIADVVTGKLDLRDAASRLPDEAGEPEPVDETDSPFDTDEAMAEEADA